MGCFDWVQADGPEFVCSEGHPIAEMQTKHLGATTGHASLSGGWFSFVNGGWDGMDAEDDAPDGPLTRTIEVYGDCHQCPAFLQARTLNLCALGVEFRVAIANDVIVAVERTSETLAEFLAREPNEPWMKGCHGPMPYAQAYRVHCRQEAPPERPTT